MNNEEFQSKPIKIVIHVFLLLGILAVLGLAIYVNRAYFNLQKESEMTIATLSNSLQKANADIAKVTKEKQDLENALRDAAAKNNAFSLELDKVEQNVDRLKAAAELDPQLLQKYSKVFFLNENYTPPAVSPLDTKYLFDKEKTIEANDRVLPFLQNMMQAAKDSGNPFEIVSGYRSFGTQASLKSAYKVVYGSGANSFSADQGYSEHQLGTAFDFTTETVGGALTGFEKTPGYSWLIRHAYEYGFILSYPKNNSYYVYEPWHWRFVGLNLALKLHNEDKNFYDLDQREISAYLPLIFNSTVTDTTDITALP